MSIVEISDLIDSYNRNKVNKIKEKALFNQVLANQISEMIALIFSGDENKVELSHLWDFFPGLFEKEKIQFEQKKEIEEFERFKQKRREFASRHNKK